LLSCYFISFVNSFLLTKYEHEQSKEKMLNNNRKQKKPNENNNEKSNKTNKEPQSLCFFVLCFPCLLQNEWPPVSVVSAISFVAQYGLVHLY